MEISESADISIQGIDGGTELSFLSKKGRGGAGQDEEDNLDGAASDDDAVDHTKTPTRVSLARRAQEAALPTALCAASPARNAFGPRVGRSAA